MKVKGGGSLELVRAASQRENPGSADLESQDTQYFSVPTNKVSLNHLARGRETCRSGAHRSAIPRHADEERSPPDHPPPPLAPLTPHPPLTLPPTVPPTLSNMFIRQGCFTARVFFIARTSRKG